MSAAGRWCRRCPDWTESPTSPICPMMEVDFLPEHLIVIGGSYIGLEFGQMYRRFGSRVTVIEMGPRLIAREDEDVSLSRAGHPARRRASRSASRRNVCRWTRKATASRRTSSCEQGAPRVVGSHLLLAVGRVPNTDDLGLDAAGIQVDQRGYRRGRRGAAHDFTRRMGAGRLQRQGRLHPHQLQRLRDRRRQPAQQRRPQVDRSDHRLRACSSTPRWGASA